MDAGTRGGNPADEGRLFPDGTDWRFRKIVHLSCQQPGDAAGEKQRQVGRRILRLRPGLAEWRDEDERCHPIGAANSGRIVLPCAELVRTAFANDQVGNCKSVERCRGVIALAVVEIFRQRRGSVRIDAGNVGTDIRKKPSAHGGGQARADLDHTEASQQ